MDTKLGFGREIQQRRLWPVFGAQGDQKLSLKMAVRLSNSPVPSLKLTPFSNWRTARPIQFDVTYLTPVPRIMASKRVEIGLCL